MTVHYYFPLEASIKEPNKVGRHGRDRVVVRFVTTYANSAYHHYNCEFETCSGELSSIQHNVIQFASDLRQVGGLLQVLLFHHQ
jgi:hypothetical protein